MAWLLQHEMQPDARSGVKSGPAALIINFCLVPGNGRCLLVYKDTPLVGRSLECCAGGKPILFGLGERAGIVGACLGHRRGFRRLA